MPLLLSAWRRERERGVSAERRVIWNKRWFQGEFPHAHVASFPPPRGRKSNWEKLGGGKVFHCFFRFHGFDDNSNFPGS